jgi:hypothetical protein
MTVASPCMVSLPGYDKNASAGRCSLSTADRATVRRPV